MRIKPKNPKVLRARRIIVGGVALAVVLFVLMFVFKKGVSLLMRRFSDD